MLNNKCWEVSHDGEQMEPEIETLDKCLEIAGLLTRKKREELLLRGNLELEQGSICELEYQFLCIRLSDLNCNSKSYNRHKSEALKNGWTEVYPYFILYFPRKSQIMEEIIAQRIKEMDEELVEFERSQERKRGIQNSALAVKFCN